MENLTPSKQILDPIEIASRDEIAGRIRLAPYEAVAILHDAG